MSLPERAPSRQTGAICIRHYDNGHNPYSDVKELMDEAVAKPLDQCKFKERYLLKHISEAKAAEERKRNRVDGGRSPRRADGGASAAVDVTMDEHKRPTSPTNKNYMAKLRAHLNHIDEIALGTGGMSDNGSQALDGTMYLEWELECKRYNDGQRWSDAVASEFDVPMCGTVLPYGLLASLMQDDGKVPLHPLLKAVYGHLTDDALAHLVVAADRQRPIPLSFSSARALHRYFAEVVKRFSKSSKVSRRSNKPGLDHHEFLTFCHNVRVMGDREAARVFAELAVEATSTGVGKVFTSDEFAAYYKM